MNKFDWVNIIGWIVILPALGVFIYLRNKKLKSKGIISTRRADYAHYEYAYTLRPVSLTDVTTALKEIDYDALKMPAVTIRQLSNTIIQADYNGKLIYWTAILELVAAKKSQCAYKFYFVRWSGNDPVNMSIFMTAVEKMFLELDWETTVEMKNMQTKYT